MPELPEVETVRRGLAPFMEGRVIRRAVAYRPDLRKPLPADLAARLSGRRVLRLDRRSKYLLVCLDDDAVLIVHLGMSGSLQAIRDAGPAGRHDHVDLVFDDVTVRFRDPRRFGLIDLTRLDALDSHPLFAKLGPEPLGSDFDGAALMERLAGRTGPVKSALMNQGVVAGLGNIYVSESLFLAGISPRRSARTVRGLRAEALAKAIRAVLARAIEAGGSSLRDHRQPSGDIGLFQHNFQVYDREGRRCPRRACPGTIRRIVQAGRATFHCRHCQR